MSSLGQKNWAGLFISSENSFRSMMINVENGYIYASYTAWQSVTSTAGFDKKADSLGGWPGRGPQAGAECFDLGHRVWHGGRPGLVVAGLRVGRCSTGPNHGILMLVD